MSLFQSSDVALTQEVKELIKITQALSDKTKILTQIFRF